MKTRQILYAEEGMVLTDGKMYGTEIYLEEGKDASLYRGISEDERRAIEAAQIEEGEV